MSDTKPVLSISVGEFVEYTLRSGDLVLDYTITEHIRAVDGIRFHQQIQSQRPKQYTPEFTLSHSVETEDFILVLSGRADGVYHYPNKAIIDEIKTTTENPDTFETKPNLLHWGQAKLYALFYATQHHLDSIDVQLTYFKPGSSGFYYKDETAKKSKTREYLQTFSIEELQAFFQDLLTGYIQWMKTLHRWHQTRNESIKQLKFPFSEYRPGQREMAVDVYKAIKESQQLIMEAPTGIGKTMASVFPAIKAVGNHLIEKFFYLTAKTTGRTVAQKAFEDLKKRGLHFKSLSLTAKDKICFNPTCGCNGEECQYARGFYDRINPAVDAVFQREIDILSQEIIENTALEFTVCPFEFSLELALWADAIIADYNYAFDPRVFLKRFFNQENTQKKYAFLVDEANNMVDRSREMFSAELYKKKFQELRPQLKGVHLGLYRAVGSLLNGFNKLKKECEDAGEPLSMPESPDDFVGLLVRFLNTAEKWLVQNIPATFRKDLISLYFETNWFLKVAEIFSHQYITTLEEIGGDFRVKLFCIDPSVLLSAAFERCKAAVFFSATLSPLDYFRQVLGCAPNAQELVLSSPFPTQNLYCAIADRVSTLYKNRDQTKTDIARMINAMVRSHAGNYLVFFPSYQYMNMIFEIFVMMNPHVERVIQVPGMTETQRLDFLERFSEENRVNGKTLVGFAVMGGVFGEGIDLVGDRLSGAAVVGVGLPGISLEREAIKEYFDEQNDSGFEFAYLYPGMNRVLQAAGRVIRTPKDHGVVVLIDHRFTTSRYRELFPHHWKPNRVGTDGQLQYLLSRFFAHKAKNDPKPGDPVNPGNGAESEIGNGSGNGGVQEVLPVS